LIFFATVIYILPFLHLYEYFFNPTIVYKQYIWGLWANEYQRDWEVVRRVAMVGMIGLFGLTAGFYAATSFFFKKRSGQAAYPDKPLTFFSFALIAFLGFILSWINAPMETILQAAYTQSISRLAGINFNAAWMLSYVFIALLFADAYLPDRLSSNNLKRRIATVIAGIVVVWLQFMRGDRECLGLIFALVAIFLKRLPAGMPLVNKKYMKNKIFGLLIFLALVFFTAQFFGAARSSSAGKKSLSSLSEVKVSYLNGTWSAVLLTPFSVIGDFYYHRMEPKGGSTYVDILKSLPPGFITQWLGIERAIEGTHGPAWEMRYGIGGTHAVVVPFMNFKSTGVFWVLLLSGFLIGKAEVCMRAPTILRTAFYATFFITIPFWFWYGEMSLIRGLMSFLVVAFFYVLLPKKRMLKNLDPQ
jgi:hypothetical protein